MIFFARDPRIGHSSVLRMKEGSWSWALGMGDGHPVEGGLQSCSRTLVLGGRYVRRWWIWMPGKRLHGEDLLYITRACLKLSTNGAQP